MLFSGLLTRLKFMYIQYPSTVHTRGLWDQVVCTHMIINTGLNIYCKQLVCRSFLYEPNYMSFFTCIVLSYHLLQLLIWLPCPCNICNISETSSRTFILVSSMLLWWLKEIGMLRSRHKIKIQFSMVDRESLFVGSVT